MRPLLVTLQETLGNPFIPEPRPLEEEKEDKDEKDEGEKKKDGEDKASDEKSEQKAEKLITIDLEGITQRVVAFPYPHGRYGQIAGIEGKAIFTAFPGQDTPQTMRIADQEASFMPMTSRSRKRKRLFLALMIFNFRGMRKRLSIPLEVGCVLSERVKRLKAIPSPRVGVVQVDRPVGLT